MRIKSAKTILLRIFFLSVLFFILQVSSALAQSGFNQDGSPYYLCDGAKKSAPCDMMAQGGEHHDPCMQHPAGPARDTCYQNQQGGAGHQPQGTQGDPCMMQFPAGPDRAACHATQSGPGHHPPGPGGPNHPPGPGHHDPCMQHPAGPARDTCYQNQPVPGQMGSCPEGPGYDACIAAQSAGSATNHHPGDTCMQHPAGPARDNCYRNQKGGPGHHPPGPGGPNHPPGLGHHDPCMQHPAGPARDTCYQNQPGPGANDHHGDQDAAHCRAMGMADGSAHVDPPQDILDQVQAEYEANCQSGNCFLGEGNYKLLEDMGHTRAKVDCFLAEGHRKHDEQHDGPGDGNHPPAP